LMRKT